jgi:hypothetical protein
MKPKNSVSFKCPECSHYEWIPDTKAIELDSWNAAIEAAAKEAERLSGQITNGPRSTIEVAHGIRIAERIRALKKNTNAQT